MTKQSIGAMTSSWSQLDCILVINNANYWQGGAQQFIQAEPASRIGLIQAL